MSVQKRLGFRGSVTSVDQCPVASISGYLKKKSSRWGWQKRYFESNNHYLVYFADDDKKKLLAAIDLYKVDGIVTVARSGQFVCQLNNDTEYCLKARDFASAAEWVQILQDRMRYFKDFVGEQPSEQLDEVVCAIMGTGPENEGWLSQRTNSKLVKWQRYYFVLRGTMLRYYKSDLKTDEVGRIPMDSIEAINPGSAHANNRILRILTGYHPFKLKAETADLAKTWIDRLEEALDWSEEARNRADLLDEDEEEEEEVLPEWLSRMEGMGTSDQLLSLQSTLDETFQGTQCNVDAVIESASKIQVDLSDMARECVRCNRGAILSLIVRFYHLRLVAEVSSFTSGEEMQELSCDQLLRLMDWIQAYGELLKDICNSASTLEGSELSEDLLSFTLTEDIESMAECYMQQLRPRIDGWVQNCVDATIQNCRVEAAEDGRPCSNGPTDFFAMMNEHLAVAQESGIDVVLMKVLLTLEDMLCAYISKLIHALRMKAMAAQSAPVIEDEEDGQASPLEIDFLCALINDVGRIMQTLESLSFAYLDVRARFASQVDVTFGKAVQACVQGGCTLSQILVDMVVGDLHIVMDKFFGPEWMQEELVMFVTATVGDYFADFKSVLDESYFQVVAVKLLDSVVLKIASKLVEVYRSKSGMFSSFVLPEDARQRVSLDVRALYECFIEHLAPEIVDRQMVVLSDIGVFLTRSPNHMMGHFSDAWIRRVTDIPRLDMSECALLRAALWSDCFVSGRKAPPVITTSVTRGAIAALVQNYLPQITAALDMCLVMRDDLSKTDRKEHLQIFQERSNRWKKDVDRRGDSPPEGYPTTDPSPPGATYASLFRSATAKKLSSLLRRVKTATSVGNAFKNQPGGDKAESEGLPRSSMDASEDTTEVVAMDFGSFLSGNSAASTASVSLSESDVDVEIDASIDDSVITNWRTRLGPLVEVVEEEVVEEQQATPSIERMDSQTRQSHVQELMKSLPLEGLLGKKGARKVDLPFQKRFFKLQSRFDNESGTWIPSLCYCKKPGGAMLGAIALRDTIDVSPKVMPAEAILTGAKILKHVDDCSPQEKVEGKSAGGGKGKQRNIFFIVTTERKYQLKAESVRGLIRWVGGLRQIVDAIKAENASAEDGDDWGETIVRTNSKRRARSGSVETAAPRGSLDAIREDESSDEEMGLAEMTRSRGSIDLTDPRETDGKPPGGCCCVIM